MAPRASAAQPPAARWLRAVGDVAIRAVAPKAVAATVEKTLEHADWTLAPGSYYVLGYGKAAEAHVEAWLARAPAPQDVRVFTATGYQHGRLNSTICGEHPIPGRGSFRAGLLLSDWLSSLEPRAPLVVFASGGASAAIELARPPWSSTEIVAASKDLLGSGLDIVAINNVRMQWSALKGGRALDMAGRRRVALAVHSDVPPGCETLVGSGPMDPGPFPTSDDGRIWFQQHFPNRPWEDPNSPERIDHWHGLRILAGANQTALEAASRVARRDGLHVEVFPEALSGDAAAVGRNIAERTQQSAADVLLFGGEPVVTLPEDGTVGQGGRLGRLVLSYGLADWKGHPAPLLALATDGKDGASDGAGAFWLPGPFDRLEAERAFEEFDSDRFFRRQRWLVETGPTGANVRDLVIVLRNERHVRPDGPVRD
ncbi:MAG: DUF4147 domain-containing protein [Candidatus Dadabacteria bacterium]|nr:MAG: DUF4147 domain-containing protein [Candidatus Dadabacteria bacterium]